MAVGVPVTVTKFLQETNAAVATAVSTLNADIAAIVPVGGSVVVLQSGISVLTGPLYTAWAMVQYSIAGS